MTLIFYSFGWYFKKYWLIFHSYSGGEDYGVRKASSVRGGAEGEGGGEHRSAGEDPVAGYEEFSEKKYASVSTLSTKNGMCRLKA